MFVEQVSPTKSIVTLSNPTAEHPVPQQALRARLEGSEVSLEGRKLKMSVHSVNDISLFGSSMLSDKAMVPHHLLGGRFKLGHAFHIGSEKLDLNYDCSSLKQVSLGSDAPEPVFETLDSFPFDERLQNVLQAADEDGNGRLSHKEISELLRACVGDQGLSYFDTQSIIAAVREDGEGFVDINRFMDSALNSVDYLRNLRSRFVDEEVGNVQHAQAAIDMCFSKELETTAKQIFEIVTNTKKPKDELIELSPQALRNALQSKCYRLTDQEVSLLVQYLDESEEGLLSLGLPKKVSEDNTADRPFELQQRLLAMRRDAVFDALPAKDLFHVQRTLTDSIRAHRDLVGRDGPLKATAGVPFQLARKILHSLDQVYLPRIASHVLLRSFPFNAEGSVGLKDFLRYATSFILFYFNEGKQFHTAEAQVAKNIAEKKAQAELNELNRFMGKAGDSAGVSKDEDKRNSQAEMDACEKSLLSHISQNLWPDHGKGLVPVSVAIAVLLSSPLPHTFTAFELLGIVSELEESGEGLTAIPPAEHIRRWLPIVWEIRRSEYYTRITPETFASVMNMVSLDLDRLGIEEEDLSDQNRQKVQGSRSRLITQGTRPGAHRTNTQFFSAQGRHMTSKRNEKSDRDLEKDLTPAITDPDELQLFSIAQLRRKLRNYSANE